MCLWVFEIPVHEYPHCPAEKLSRKQLSETLKCPHSFPRRVTKYVLLIGVGYFRGFKFRDPGKKIGKPRYLKNQKYRTSERNNNMLKFEGKRKPRNFAEEGEKSQNPGIKMYILAISEERMADPGISSTNWLSCVERNGSKTSENVSLANWYDTWVYEESRKVSSIVCLEMSFSWWPKLFQYLHPNESKYSFSVILRLLQRFNSDIISKLCVRR